MVENLHVKYDNFEIYIPFWEFPDMGVTALWGESGSGKTSLLRVLVGLEPCPHLRWEFKGENLAKLRVEQRNLGVVFQSYELFPHMTARENILFAARARGVVRPEIDRFIDALHLGRVLHTKASQLSGGEKQRVALARALIGGPRALLLDEPFSCLDSSMREESRRLVRDVMKGLDIPTLLITHDLEDIRYLADHRVELASLAKDVKEL